MNIVSDITIQSIFALIGTLVGTLGGIIASAKLTNYRIQQLEKRVEKHNNLIERTFLLEQNQAVLSEKMDEANHRIADIEKRAG